MNPWHRWKARRALDRLRNARSLSTAQVAAAQAELRSGPAESMIPMLLGALSHGAAREPALEVLAHYVSEATTPRFLDALCSSNPAVASGATHLLSTGKHIDRQVVLDALEGAQVPRTALDTILTAHLEQLRPESLIAGFGSATKDSRAIRLRLLERSADVRILDPVCELTEHESWWVRMYMARLLARIGTSPGAVALVRLLSDEHRSVRLEAVQGVAHLEAHSAVPALVGLLRDTDLKIQSAAIDALGKLADARAVPLLIEVLKDEAEHARRGAVEVLNRVATEEAIQDLVRALRDADWWVRVRAADALGTLGGERVVDAVIGLLDDPDEFLRRYGVEILNSVPNERAVPALITALDDADWWVRERAIDALAESHDVRAVAPLLHIMDTRPEIVPLGARALGAFDDPRVVGRLLELLTSDSDEIRREARAGLERLALPCLSEDDRARVRAALGKQASDAAPLTVSGRQDPETGRASKSQPDLIPSASVSATPTREATPESKPAEPSSAPINFYRLSPGDRLLNRFEVLRRIGSGGFGAVYLVNDTAVSEQIILKVLNPQLGLDESSLARFVQELKLTRRVTHENVIRIHDFMDLGGAFAVSMEYFDGLDLGQLLEQKPRRAPSWALSMAEQVCRGLAAAHDAGVVHRDIKPGNILLDGEGRVKIVDFGLAAGRHHVGSRLTKSGILVGTPEYMAPEQITGGAIDGRTDLYALGVVLYETLSGARAFQGDTAVQILFQHLEGEVPRLRALDPSVDPALDELVAAAMARDPQDRPASARDLEQQLHALRTLTRARS